MTPDQLSDQPNFAGVEGQTPSPTGATAETGWGGASAKRTNQRNTMRYRYKVIFDVVIEGDGFHANGDGAYATLRRLQDALKGDARVVRLGTDGPRWVGDRAASDETQAERKAT